MVYLFAIFFAPIRVIRGCLSSPVLRHSDFVIRHHPCNPWFPIILFVPIRVHSWLMLGHGESLGMG
jgi:hypothetical protein